MDIINYRNFEEMLLSEGEYVTILNGSSMFPMVRHGKDPVLIVTADRPLKRYDVAVYRRPGRYVVHRVLECRPDCYVIRGDNCVAKEHVLATDIVGVVSGFWRNGHYVPVTNCWYRAYARIWVMINPLVRIHHFVVRAVRYITKSQRLS